MATALALCVVVPTTTVGVKDGRIKQVKAIEVGLRQSGRMASNDLPSVVDLGG